MSDDLLPTITITEADVEAVEPETITISFDNDVPLKQRNKLKRALEVLLGRE